MKAEDLTLTVMDDDWSNQLVPVDGYNLDGNQHNQFLLLSTELSSMNGSNIKGLKFYFNRTGHSWSNTSQIPTVVFKLKVVENTSLSSQITVDETFTQVYSGTINFDFSNKVWNVTFDTPFAYNGGNLLIDLQTTKNGSTYVKNSGSNAMRYYTAQISNRVMVGSSAGSYFPKTTFTYELAGCTTPKSLSATEASSTAASVTWTAGSTETAWQLRYREKTEPESSWSSPLTEVSTTPASNLTGLTTDKTYEVQVRSNCGEGDENKSEWTEAAEFSLVSCPTVTNVTLSDKVYNGVTVNWATGYATNCDVRYKETGDADWTSAGNNLEGTSKAITGLVVGKTYSFQVKPNCSTDGWVAAGETYTPAYTTPGVPTISNITKTSASASWAAATGGATGYEYELKEGTAAATWTNVMDAEGGSASLTGLDEGTKYTLYVRAKFGTGRGDAVSANFTTSTVAPEFSTAAPEIGTTTASIMMATYQGTASQYQYVCMVSTATPNWASASLVASSSTKIDLSDLEPGTTYKLYVRAYYSENVISNSVSKEFQTDCGTYTLPFSQNFGTSGTTKPNCWVIANWGTSANSWTLAGDFSQTGNALRYNAKTNSSCHATSPSIYLDDKAELKFYVRNYYYYYSTYYISGKVIITDGETVKEEAYGNNSSITQKTVDLSEFAGKTVTITFQGNGAGTSMSSAYLWIDDVTITYLPAAAPTNVAAAATTDGAVVTWDCTENGPFQLHYRAVGATDWIAAGGNITEKTYTLTGLDEIEYEVEVRNYASANRYSDYVAAAATFTPQCPNVTAVTYTNPTYNSVTVNWEASGSDTWSLRYKAAGDDWTVVENIATNTYDLTGLNAGTAYSVEVKATCKDETGYVPAATYTPACSAPENAVVENISDATATASWDAVADAPNGYKYIVVEAGEAPNWASATATDELTASLTNLAGLSGYDFYVAAIYGDHVEAAAAVNFQTDAVAPTDLTQGATTVNSIAFSWIYAGAATQFQWKSSKEGSDWSAPIGEMTATEIGLTAGTPYTISVRAYYADGKYSAELSETFGTECAVLTLPFSQDFEAGTSPLCWTAVYNTIDYYNQDGNYTWKVTEDNDGNYVMRYKSGTALTMPALTLPQIDLTGAVSPSLSFKVLNNYSNKTVAGKVIVSAAEMSDQETVLTTSSSLTEQRIDLSSFAGKVITIKFQATSNNNGGRIDLDDIRISEYLNLADADDNAAILSANLNNTVDMTINRTFYCDTYYNTICLPFSLSEEQIANSPIKDGELLAFKYGYVENGELLLRVIPVTAIEAGIPYIISFAQGGNIVNPLFKNVTIGASVGEEVGETDDVKFVGILKPQSFTQNDKTKLFILANNQIAWSGVEEEGHSLKGFRAFFLTTTPVGTNPSSAPIYHGMPARIVLQEEVITGCENINAEGQTIKLLENNQVVIIRNGVKYTIQGQKIQ